MISVIGFHDAGIARLTAFRIAPVFERFHGSAGGHVLIQTAGGVAAGVLGVLVGQSGKRVFRGIAGQEVRQQRFGLSLGFFLGGLVGGVLRGDENVTDIGQLIGHIHVLHKVQHIVAVGGIINIGGVAGLPGVIADPVAVELQAVIFRISLPQGGGICVVALLLIRRRIFQSQLQECFLAALGRLSHGLGLFFHLGQGFLADGILAVFVGGVRFSGQIEHPEGHAVKVSGIRRIVGIDLILGVDQRGHDTVFIFLSQIVDSQEFLEVGLVAAGTIDGGQIGIAAAVAVDAGHQIHALQLAVDGSLRVFAEFKTLGDGFVINGIGAGGSGQGGIQQIVVPRGIFIREIGLFRKRCFRIGKNGQQLLIVLIGIGVIVVDHGGSQLMTADHGGSGVGLKESAADHTKEDDGGHQYDGDYDAEYSFDSFTQSFFGILGRSGLSSQLFLALFLFAGCAHVVVHSSHTSCSRQCDTS